ncbi:MAG: dienelactone hydrolase family protein [Bacteroidetes bacterium]|nr:dienelactone hydrolase family protein [Bacteroidota bacterium]
MVTRSDLIMLEVTDGTAMQAYCAQPAGGPMRAGLIVGQEAYGVNSHIKNICDRLAGEGYVAIAPEFLHRTTGPGSVWTYTDFESARPHVMALTQETIAADLAATFHHLRSMSNEPFPIGSIGFCMGGRVSFLANVTLPIVAGVSFYAGGMMPLLPRASEVHAPHLFVWGGLDKSITHEHVEAVAAAMKGAGKEFVSAEFSHAEHGFHCDERAAYNPRAATEAWALSMAFLRNRLLV